MKPTPKYSKYHSRKIEADGQRFDSKKEYQRWQKLRFLEDIGEIRNLRRQVKYVLIPAQYEQGEGTYAKGRHKGEPRRGKLLERECAYYADFVYEFLGKTIVEDCKGVRTETYKIKRKLMLERYGIRIEET